MITADLPAPGPDSCELRPAGRAWFIKLGVDPHALRGARRAFARPCLDWTERQPHLAGALGAAVATTFLTRSWIVRLPDTR